MYPVGVLKGFGELNGCGELKGFADLEGIGELETGPIVCPTGCLAHELR